MSLDLICNVPVLEDPPYVMSGAFWIALAVRANTVARGVQLANQLRREVSRLHISSSGAVDLHSFFADPDPAVLLNADPDPALKKL